MQAKKHDLACTLHLPAYTAYTTCVHRRIFVEIADVLRACTRSKNIKNSAEKGKNYGASAL